MTPPDTPRRFAARPRAFVIVAIALLVGSVQCSGPTEPKVKPVSTVRVSPGSAALLIGQTSQLSATASDAGGVVLTDRAITWSSSDAGRASVSASGLVSALAAGSVTITATAEGKSGSASVSVAPVPVATVAVSVPTVQLLVGQTQQLVAASKDSVGNDLSGRALVWSSSDTGKATVSVTGLITAVGPGTAVITVSSEGKSATVAVTVIGPPVSVAFASQLLFLAPAASANTSVAVRDVNDRVVPNTALAFTSRSPAVATVSAAGTVTGVAAGQATIVVSAAGGAGAVLDSLVAVVAGATTPVLATSLGAMSLKADTTLTVSVIAHWGASAPRLASGILVVTWPANALTLTATNTGAQTVPAVNDAAATTGTLQIAFADASGFTGGAEVARLTFHVAATAGVAGTLSVTTRELGGSDFSDLTAVAFTVLHRFVIR